MSENIKSVKISFQKVFEGDKGIDEVKAEFSRYYGNTDLSAYTPFLKIAFPDGTKNKFALTKTVGEDKIVATRTVDGALTKCAGKLKGQIALEDALGNVVMNSSVFVLRIEESVKDETNLYTEIPSAVTDLQRELQSDIDQISADIEMIESDISAMETFMEDDYVNTVNGRKGAVTLSKSDVGLSNVDNTSDMDKPVSTATSTALAGKVDKVSGKGLSTEDYTTEEKNKLASLENYDDNALIAALSEKADSDDVSLALAEKVDKVQGKGLSTNDYTTAEKEKLELLHNYDDTGVLAALAQKADASTMSAALALKADTSAVNDALLLKADSSDVSAALADKVGIDAQSFTDAQKKQARENIDAVGRVVVRTNSLLIDYANTASVFVVSNFGTFIGYIGKIISSYGMKLYFEFEQIDGYDSHSCRYTSMAGGIVDTSATFGSVLTSAFRADYALSSDLSGVSSTLTAALAGKSNKLSTVTDTASSSKTLNLSNNTRYILGVLTDLAFTFPTTDLIDGDTIILEFVSGSTATTLTRDTTNAVYNFTSVSADVFVELNAEFKASINKWVVLSAETYFSV